MGRKYRTFWELVRLEDYAFRRYYATLNDFWRWLALAAFRAAQASPDRVRGTERVVGETEEG